MYDLSSLSKYDISIYSVSLKEITSFWYNVMFDLRKKWWFIKTTFYVLTRSEFIFSQRRQHLFQRFLFFFRGGGVKMSKARNFSTYPFESNCAFKVIYQYMVHMDNKQTIVYCRFILQEMWCITKWSCIVFPLLKDECLTSRTMWRSIVHGC